MKIGIPRALHTYTLGGAWEAFLGELGVEVILSPPTTRPVLEAGIALGPRDLCLPLKAFFGHLEALRDGVDAVFVPRLVSVDPRRYYCPKFLALPDLAACVLPRERLVVAEVNAKKGPGFTRASYFRAARSLGAGEQQFERAWAALGEAERTARVRRRERYDAFPDAGGGSIRVGLMGHAYTVGDAHLSSHILEWLGDRDVSVLTTDAVPEDVIEAVNPGLFRDIYWESAQEIFRASLHLLKSGRVDGGVFVSAFGCGPDSFVGDLLSRRSREGPGFPFVHIVLDEHTARTGLQTRLEAFLDMVTMKAGRTR
jgi:predicted nucleotide-binding protein (sugar kinase/HSP70/actin superfamily)